MFCKCGNQIPEKRLEILKQSSMKIQCIQCAESNVSKVAGFMVRDHKMSGELQVMSQEQADHMHSLSSRSGGMQVSRGVRFSTGRK